MDNNEETVLVRSFDNALQKQNTPEGDKKSNELLIADSIYDKLDGIESLMVDYYSDYYNEHKAEHEDDKQFQSYVAIQLNFLQTFLDDFSKSIVSRISSQKNQPEIKTEVDKETVVQLKEPSNEIKQKNTENQKENNNSETQQNNEIKQKNTENQKESSSETQQSNEATKENKKTNKLLKKLESTMAHSKSKITDALIFIQYVVIGNFLPKIMRFYYGKIQPVFSKIFNWFKELIGNIKVLINKINASTNPELKQQMKESDKESKMMNKATESFNWGNATIQTATQLDEEIRSLSKDQIPQDMQTGPKDINKEVTGEAVLPTSAYYQYLKSYGMTNDEIKKIAESTNPEKELKSWISNKNKYYNNQMNSAEKILTKGQFKLSKDQMDELKKNGTLNEVVQDTLTPYQKTALDSFEKQNRNYINITDLKSNQSSINEYQPELKNFNENEYYAENPEFKNLVMKVSSKTGLSTQQSQTMVYQQLLDEQRKQQGYTQGSQIRERKEQYIDASGNLQTKTVVANIQNTYDYSTPQTIIKGAD